MKSDGLLQWLSLYLKKKLSQIKVKFCQNTICLVKNVTDRWTNAEIKLFTPWMNTITWLLVWVSRKKGKVREANLSPANILNGQSSTPQASQYKCHMILLCVTLSGEEVSCCWCSWYAAAPGMPPSTTEGWKKKYKYSRSLRLLGLSHVMLKLCQTTEQKHCHIVWESVWLCIWPPPLHADNISVTILSISSHDGCLLQENLIFISFLSSYMSSYVLLFPTTSVSYVPFLII